MNSWLYSSFKFYASRLGLNILRDDFIFIEQCLSHIPDEEQKITMKEYTKIWKDCMHDIPDKTRAQNAGRFAANVYLREQSE